MEADVLFAGQVPRIYHDCLGPIMFEAFAGVVAQRLRPGDRKILETAAGTGIVSRAVSELLPDSRIIATDLNPGMLDIARATALPNVTWQQADALGLPFDDHAFDLVICAFGMMFMPDKVAAFREARRVLRPGGRFLFTVWDRLAVNPVSQVVAEAMVSLFPEDPPRFFERMPFGYSDRERIRHDARAGGFAQVDLEIVRRETRYDSVALPARGMCQGTPLRNEIEARPGADLEAATEWAAAALRARYGSGPFRAPSQAVVGTAW